MEIKIEGLGFSYGDKEVLKDVNLTIDKPELVCLIGPNGVGKTTLMHCINKLQKPTAGRILIDGTDLNDIKLKQLSKFMSFVPESEDATFSMTVLDTVLMGRMPHSGATPKAEDIRIAAESIKLLGMEDFALQGTDELSAGQHQKVMIARSLAQEPKIMLLDEPTANLDVKYQMIVMRLLRDVARVKGITVITICHDLNVTAMYADRVIMLYEKGVYTDGKPEEVLTAENIRTIYGVDCEVMKIRGNLHIIILDSDDLDSHLEDIMAENEAARKGEASKNNTTEDNLPAQEA